MATYVYETIPQRPDQPRRRFEIRQSMNDAPLTHDPATGEPVQRIISGGYGYIGAAKSDAPAPRAHSHSGGCGHGSCGCAH